MWASTHQQEAEQIALDVATINNTIPQRLNSVSSVNIPPKEGLRTSFDKHQKQLNDQATISNINNKTNDIIDKNIEHMLIQRVDSTELEKLKTLDQLSAKVDDKKAQMQDEFDKTPESTIVRTGKQVADNIGISDEAIKKRNIKLSGYKNENKLE